MNIYHVQDDDREMWVLADGFLSALKRWRTQMLLENPCLTENEIEDPAGVTLIASGSDIKVFPMVLL